MNERIKELINQVGTDVSGKWMNIDNAGTFAELIVRECANMFNETDAVTGSFVKKVLKEHFGIEE